MAAYPQLREAAAELTSLNELRIEMVHNWFRTQTAQPRCPGPRGRTELIAELHDVVDRLGTTVAAISANSLFIAFGQGDGRPAGAS